MKRVGREADKAINTLREEVPREVIVARRKRHVPNLPALVPRLLQDGPKRLDIQRPQPGNPGHQLGGTTLDLLFPFRSRGVSARRLDPKEIRAVDAQHALVPFLEARRPISKHCLPVTCGSPREFVLNLY